MSTVSFSPRRDLGHAFSARHAERWVETHGRGPGDRVAQRAARGGRGRAGPSDGQGGRARRRRGGTEDGALGTSLRNVVLAVDSVGVGDGLRVDLGSAALVAGMARPAPSGESLPAHLGCGPLVEGTILAAWEMSGGGSMDVATPTAETDRQKNCLVGEAGRLRGISPSSGGYLT